MWLIAEYQPVSLFSLRSGLATSSGAKTLFLPTPFAIRTALVDAAIRTQGLAAGRNHFSRIKGLTLAIRPPERVVVTNLFAKILKPTRSKEEKAEPMVRTIAFREYAQLDGTLALAFKGEASDLAALGALLPQVNYFGKRGSFFQMVDEPQEVAELPEGFLLLDGASLHNNRVDGEGPEAFPLDSIIQMMDDWGPSLTFNKLNIYSEEKIILGKDRMRKSILLPYRLVRASKGFSYYERTSV